MVIFTSCIAAAATLEHDKSRTVRGGGGAGAVQQPPLHRVRLAELFIADAKSDTWNDASFITGIT